MNSNSPAPSKPTSAGRCHQIMETPEGKMRREEGEIKLVGAVYEIASGQ